MINIILGCFENIQIRKKKERETKKKNLKGYKTSDPDGGLKLLREMYSFYKVLSFVELKITKNRIRYILKPTEEKSLSEQYV